MKYLHQFVTTNLNVGGGIDDSQTTGIVLQSLNNIDATKPSVACVTWADPLDTSVAEWVTYTSINSTTNELQGVTRGGEGYSAKSHLNQAVIAFPLSKSHVNDLNTAVSAEHSTAGVHSVSAMISGGSVLDEDDMASDSATALATQQSIKAYADNAPYTMSRQAIINGNFDVWQRGTSIALTTADGYTADRWYVETATAGTDKTVSRQDGTGVNGSYYCARVKMVSDVDELLTFSQALESQDSIKFRGKKVTLSFYARGGAEFVADNATLVSKIVTGKGTDQKVLAFTTSADAISQNNTLTTSWVKFTCTTSAVIASDITQIGVSFAFTHAGSGTTTNYFEVTQVQLCSGSTALPFQPKTFDEELRACQRYFEKSYDYADALSSNTLEGIFTGTARASSTTGTNGLFVPFKVKKRTSNPTVVTYRRDGSGTNPTFWRYDETTYAAITIDSFEGGFRVFFNGTASGLTARDAVAVDGHWTAESEI